MFSLRDYLIFLAGAATFHTISHLTLAFSGALPMVIGGVEVTSQLNILAIAINTLITIGLLWWASRLSK